MAEFEDEYTRAQYFKITLKLRHPSMPVSAMADGMGMVPEYGWSDGDEKRARFGRLLPGGPRKGSYCYFPSRVEGRRHFFKEAFEHFQRHIEPKATFLTMFQQSGGDVALDISLPGHINLGDVASVDFLSALLRHRIELGLEVFPDMP